MSATKRVTQSKHGTLFGDGYNNHYGNVVDFDNMGVDELLQYFASVAQDSSSAQRKAGASYSQTDVANMMYERASLEDERAYTAERWEIESSVQGMVNQYKEAGMNPVLATGIQPTSGNASSGGGQAAGGEGTQEPTALETITQIMEFLGMAGNIGMQAKGVDNETQQTESNVNLQSAQADKEEAQADLARTQKKNIENQNELYELTKDYKVAAAALENKETEARINKIFKDIEVQNENINLIKSQTGYYEAKIAVAGSEVTLNLASADEKSASAELSRQLAIGARLDNEKARRLLPFVEQTQLAQLKAQDASADKDYAQAALLLVEKAKEQGLIDAGYTEQVVKDLKSRRITRNVNCIVGNLCNIINTAVGAATGTSSLMGNMNSSGSQTGNINTGSGPMIVDTPMYFD